MHGSPLLDLAFHELLDKSAMFGRCDALLGDFHDANQVAAQQRLVVEPQAWKNAALQDATARWQRLELAALQAEPIDGSVAHAPHEGFANAVASVGVQLL